MATCLVAASDDVDHLDVDRDEPPGLPGQERPQKEALLASMWSGFRASATGPSDWEAGPTLTTLEATRPDRASRPSERAALHRDLVGRDLPGSGAVPSRQRRRCAARCARPFGPSLDCPAQLRCLAMNVAPEGDLRSRQLPLQLGRLVGDLQSPFPARTSCSGPQSRSHPDHMDARRPRYRHTIMFGCPLG